MSRWTMGTMATRRRETVRSSAARRARPTARSTSTSPTRWRSAWPRGRGRRRGATSSGALMTTAISPRSAELPPRVEPSVYEIEKRNAFQRELEAAQEDTRRREELRREAELRLRQGRRRPSIVCAPLTRASAARGRRGSRLAR